MPATPALPKARPGPASDVRFIGDIPGCYVLSSRENAGDDQVRVFACRSRSISPQVAVLQAPLRGAVGERVALRLDGLGLLKAAINRTTADGFVVDLLLTARETATIAKRIEWLKQRALKAVTDRREAKRWLPRDANTRLILPSKQQIDCFIIDMSATGVAVSADVAPGVGHPVVVGSVLGRVARRLEFGFAVQFLVAQDPQRVESLVSPAKDSKRELLAEALAAAEAAYEAERAAAAVRADTA